MIPRLIEVGPLTFHTYGLIMGSAILTGWYVAKKRASLYKIKEEIFDGWTVFIPITLGIISARLYHVFDYWYLYKTDLFQIIQLQKGGLGIWGGIAGGIIGVLIFCRIKKIKFLKVLDLLAPSVALGQAIGRFGNFVNQEGFGPPTNLPWAVFISPENRPPQYLLTSQFHPTFFYEAILDLIIFLSLIYLSKVYKRTGQTFALYLIFYSTVRFFIEFLRMDTWTIGTIKIAQLISIVGFTVGAWLFLRGRRGWPS